MTDDNVTKRRDYEDEVVKVFYLKNPTSVQEFQEIITAVRSVTDVRRMFTYNAQNAVMVRSPPPADDHLLGADDRRRPCGRCRSRASQRQKIR